jgi:GTPase Era involved in 16S rRNA processing
VEALERALEVGGDRLDPRVRRAVADAVAGVRERLTLGIDHTIVALVGGTGSGKSSLFNAVCGLPFSDVGVKRPTTSEATACVWGTTGAPLLDWLGVAPDRRFERETALDGDAQADLRGLVLLDLPDYDSVESAHRDVVDRLLPMVDLLVWVVDPQKYADDALHSGYLRGLAGHEAAMMVVLNQVDTVPAQVRDRLVDDVARLLAEDGLVGVRVQPTSVATGFGVGELRATLAGVVAGPSVAAVRAGAEVDAAARLLTEQVAPREATADELPTSGAVDSLAEAAGLPVIAAAVEASVRSGRGRGTVPSFGAVQPDTVDLARHRWLADVTRGLPTAWQRATDARVARSDELRMAVDRALHAVPLGVRRSGAALAATAAAALAGLAALGVAALLVVAAVTESGAADSTADRWATPVLAGTLAVVALVLALVAVALRRRAGRRRAAALRREGRAALDDVVASRLAAPTLRVLGEHREVRELAASAVDGRSPARPFPAAASASLPSRATPSSPEPTRGKPSPATPSPAAPRGRSSTG